MVVLFVMCFFLFVMFSLSLKVVVVYLVDCIYLSKSFDFLKFFVIVLKIWKRIFVTYLWVCILIVGCFVFFFVLLVVVSSVFLFMGFFLDLILYFVMVVGLIFFMILANVIIMCNIFIVIFVLEDVLGLRVLLSSSLLIKG